MVEQFWVAGCNRAKQFVLRNLMV